MPTSSPTALDRSPETNPPKYPRELAKRSISGNVVLLVDVDAEGNPTAVEVDDSVPAGAFDAVAIEAAWKWKFQPALENGRPVADRRRVYGRVQGACTQGARGELALRRHRDPVSKAGLQSPSYRFRFLDVRVLQH